MSDTPLPEASPADRAAVAAGLAGGVPTAAFAAIGGTVDVAPRLAAATSPGDVVFVLARRPGDPGPPLAAERLEGNAYPLPFTLDLTAALAAGAGGPVQVIAKLDRDGDAGTSVAEDLLGFTPAPVSPGTDGVRVTLEASLGEIAAELERSGEPPPAAGAAAVSGTVLIPDDLRGRTSPADVLFVTARRAGASGPPVAAARLRGNAYPMPFALRDDDRMLGGPWPDTLTVEVRRDADGDPLTRGADDLVGRTGPLARGARGVRVTLGGGP
jgi:hypothetical protein